jgi:hypothetical protein
MVPLDARKIAGRNNHEGILGNPVSAAACGAISAEECLFIDAIRHGLDCGWIRPKFKGQGSQFIRHRDHAARPPDSPRHAYRLKPLMLIAQFAATHRDHERNMKGNSKQGSRNSLRVSEVGVNQVDVTTGTKPGYRPKQAEIQEECVQPAAERRIEPSRMEDSGAVVAPRRRDRETSEKAAVRICIVQQRDRRNYGKVCQFGNRPQPRVDKEPLAGLCRIWVFRTQTEDFQGAGFSAGLGGNGMWGYSGGFHSREAYFCGDQINDARIPVCSNWYWRPS